MCLCPSSDSSSGNRLSESSCSDGGSGTPLSDRASLIGLDFQNQYSPEQNQDQDSEEAGGGGLDRGVKDGEGVESSSNQCGLVAEDQPTETVTHPCDSSLFPAPTDPSVSSLFSCPSSHLPPGSLLLQSLENQLNPVKASGPGAEVVPPTPDVDLLLECTFSYMHNTEEEDVQEQQPMEEQEDEFLSPLIGPEEEEVG